MVRRVLRLFTVACLLTLLAAPRGAAQPPVPDETGAIPIVMYHSVGELRRGVPMRVDRGGLNITPATFRRHLNLMRNAGWYPVNMRDAASPAIAVPAGKTPVAITFDDARGSQVRLLPDGTLDPDCAFGILTAFSREHPDWPLRATFYVLPASSYNPVPFWQRGREAAKLDMLLRAGCEVGNHSLSHGWMNRMDAARIQLEVAECIRRIRKLAPGATMDTFCVPYGAMPRTTALLRLVAAGKQGGTAYRNLVVLRAWGGPSYPPAHRRYDPLRVARLGCRPGEVEITIRGLTAAHPMRRFISDGDPAVVTTSARHAGDVNRAAMRDAGVRLVLLRDAAPAAAPPAAGTAKRR